MPRTNYPTKVNRIAKAADSLKALSKTFRGECSTAKNLAEALEVSAPTAAARLGNPQGLTLEELITATVNLGFTGSLSVKKGEMSVEINW